MPTATKKRGSQSKSNLKRNEAREKKRDKEVREIWFNPHATEMRESRMGFCNCECQLLRDERIQQELQRIAKVYSQVDTAVEEGEEDEEETQSKGCCGGSKSKKSKVKSSESEPKSDKAPSKNKNAKKGKSKDERDKSKDKKDTSKDKKEKSKDKKEKDKTKDKKNSIAARKGSVVKVGSQSIVVYRNCRFKTREEAKRYRELKSIYTTRPRARPSSASTKEKKKDKKSKRKERSDMERCPSSSSEESTNAREEKQAQKHKSRKDTEKSSSRRPRPRPTSSNSDYPQESASRQHKRDGSKSKQKKKKSGGGCFGRRKKSNDDNDAYRPAQKSSTASAASNGRSMLPPECPFTPEELELLEKLRATYARDAANKNWQRRAETEPDKADTGCCGSKKKKRTPIEDESNYSLHSQYTHDSFSHHDCRCAENYSTTFKQKYTTCESTSEIFTSNLQSCDAQSCRADKVQYDDNANGTVAARYGAEKEKCAAMLLPLRSESAAMTGELGNKVNTAQTQTDYQSGQPKSKGSKSVKEPSLQDSNTDTACSCLRYLKMRNKRGTHSETSAENTNHRPCCEHEACTMQKPKHTPTEKGTNEATETLIESEMEKQAHNETELLSAHVEKVASKISMQNETTEQLIESEQCKRLSSEKECLCEDAQKVPSKTSQTSVLSRRENGSNTDLKGPNKSNMSIQTEAIQQETTKASTSCCPIGKKRRPKKSDDHEGMRSNSKNQIGALNKAELEIEKSQILDRDQQKLCQNSSFCTLVKVEPQNKLPHTVDEKSTSRKTPSEKSDDFVNKFPTSTDPNTDELKLLEISCSIDEQLKSMKHDDPAGKSPNETFNKSSSSLLTDEKLKSAQLLDTPSQSRELNQNTPSCCRFQEMEMLSKSNDFRRPSTVEIPEVTQRTPSKLSIPSCCAIAESKSFKVSSREEFTATESDQVIVRAPSKNPTKCWPIGMKDRTKKSDNYTRRRSTLKSKENDENIESKKAPPCCRNSKEFQKQVDSNETQTQFEPAQTEMHEIPGKPGACCAIDMKNKKELEYSEMKLLSIEGPDKKNTSFKPSAAACGSEAKPSDVKGKYVKKEPSKKSCCPITYYPTVNKNKSKELKDSKKTSSIKASDKEETPFKGKDLQKTTSKKLSCCPITYYSNVNTDKSKELVYEKKPAKTEERDLKMASFKTMSARPSLPHRESTRKEPKHFETKSTKKEGDGKVPDVSDAPPETTVEEKSRQGFESAEKPKKAMQKSTEEHVNKKPTSCCPIRIRHKSKNLQFSEKRPTKKGMPHLEEEEEDKYKTSEGTKDLIDNEEYKKDTSKSLVETKPKTWNRTGSANVQPTGPLETLEQKSSKMSPRFEEEEAKHKTSEGSKDIIDNEEYRKDISKSLKETKPKTWNRTGSANVKPTGPLETLEQKSSKISPRFEEEEAKHKTSEGSKDIIDNEEYRKDISKSLKDTKPKTWNRTGSANVQPTSSRRELEKIPKRLPDKTSGTPNKITPNKSKRRSRNKENNNDAYKKKPSSLSYCEALYTDLENIFIQRYQCQAILGHTKDFKAKSSKTTKPNTQQESQTNAKAAKESKDRTNKEIKQEETNETTPNLRYKSNHKDKLKKKIEKINKKENLKSAKPPPPFAPCYGISDSQIKQAYVPEYVLGQTQNQMGGVCMSPSRQIKYTVILSSNAKKKCYKDPDKAPDINYFDGYGLDCQN